MKKIWNSTLCIAFSLFCLLSACQREIYQTQSAFYHWQTQLSIDSIEQGLLNQIHCERLYVKFFDVDWDYNRKEASPRAELLLEKRPEQHLDIVPTIFITNRCFQELPQTQLGELASTIYEKTQALWPDLIPIEIQIDCDWTATTQAAYFSFLEQLKSLLPPETALSTTIRLHQYRYPKQTGVPPVDRGMLMYYNMGDLTDWTEVNSILNLDKAAPYLEPETYPLPLDLALPLFRWGVLFREGRMIKLINNLTDADINSSKVKNLKSDVKLGYSRWLVTEDHYLNGYYLYKGDQIRLEYITKGLLEQAAHQLGQLSQKNDRYLSFYHLDRVLLENNDLLPADLIYLSKVLD